MRQIRGSKRIADDPITLHKFYFQVLQLKFGPRLFTCLPSGICRSRGDIPRDQQGNLY